MYCRMVNNNIEIKSTGSLGVCCVSDFVIKKDDGTDYTINDSLEEARNSASLQELRRQINAGEKPDWCKRCWDLESAGSDSKRTIENRRPLDTVPTNKFSIKTMDLKPGNICNLKCMICYSGASSKWIKEEIDLNGQSHFKLLNWGENSDFAHKIIDHLDEVEYIEISGGETFMIAGVFELLKLLVQNGVAQNITVQIHTNATIYPEEHIDLLKKFKKIIIVFSIDGYGDVFEYNRFPGKWNEVEEVMHKFNQYTDFENKICCSISILNICELGDLFEWTKQNNMNIFLNMVGSKFNFDHLSLDSKSKIKNYLIANNVDFSVCDNVNEDNWIMNMLERDTNMHNEKNYLAQIKKHDAYRGIDFSKVSPVVWEVLTK